MKLLILADDKITRAFIRDYGVPDEVCVAIDRSTNIGRVSNLVYSGALSVRLLVRMAIAEWLRPAAPPIAGSAVRSNDELLAMVRDLRPQMIVLFRAGIIVRKSLIDTGIPIWNVHCSRLPDFGGLGTIWRALRAGELEQAATAHVVTEKIDAGEVLATEPYRLDPAKSYAENEGDAYAAGARLLSRILRDEIAM